MDNETAATITTVAAQCPERIAVEVSRAARMVQIDVDLCERHRGIDVDAHLQREAVLRRQLDAALVWYRHPVFVATVAVVLTSAAIVTARYTVVRP